MKYCICLRGKHYQEDSGIDYRVSLDNYRTNLLKPILDQGHEIFIFILTYDSAIINQLIDDYKPVSRCILPVSEINLLDGWERQKEWHSQSIHMIHTYENTHSITFDYILNTRFDLLFFTSILSNINYNKINIMYKHDSGNCDDNFFFFPRYHLNTFDNAITQLKIQNQITHAICHFMNENDNIHYMYSLSNWNEEFKIVRNGK